MAVKGEGFSFNGLVVSNRKPLEADGAGFEAGSRRGLACHLLCNTWNILNLLFKIPLQSVRVTHTVLQTRRPNSLIYK